MKYLELLKKVAAFAAHILAAVLIFLMVGLAAYALHAITGFLAAHHIDSFVLFGMKALELLLYGCDFIATTVWVVKSTAHFMDSFKE